MKLFFTDGTSVTQDKYTDTYFVGFNSNIFLRESCYNCKYCGQERIADFTAADFWGVTNKRVSKQQLYDGVSVLLVNTDKAKKILPDLRDFLKKNENVNLRRVIVSNARKKDGISKIQVRPIQMKNGIFYQVIYSYLLYKYND